MDPASYEPSTLVVTTSLVTGVTAFLLGLYSGRGYLISPELAAERAANFNDPVESEESDVDEDDTLLDHAPNWANAAEADRRQGLRLTEAGKRNTARAEAAADDQGAQGEAQGEGTQAASATGDAPAKAAE